MTWDFKLRTEPARVQTRAIVEEEIRNMFELDVKPDAVRNSPVKTGTNRRSIDVDFDSKPTGIVARLFTQSGYGGYLEVGTRYMKKRPYLYPAFRKGVTKLTARLKNSIEKQK